MSLYRDLHQRHLEKWFPEIVAELKSQGQWESHLAEVGQAARDLHETIYGEYLHNHPPPKGEDDFLKVAQHMNGAGLVAKEIVLHDLVFQPVPSQNEDE